MLEFLNSLLWDKLLVVLLLALGLGFTVLSRGLQFRFFGRMFRVLAQAFQHKEGQLSSFQALMLSVAGRVGSGNIAGVAVAISLGGPGAVFWMWVVGLLGMATSFFECTLGQVYKHRLKDGSFRGGPAYYIVNGIGSKWLAAFFSMLLLVTFGLAFVAVQSYTVAASFEDAFGIAPRVTGAAMALLLGAIIFGGVQRIAGAAEVIVPVMAVAYIAIALYVIMTNLSGLPTVFVLIFKSALGLEQAVGGGIGAAIIMGVKRGLFSSEAGLGSAPNVAAVAYVKHPASQGIVQAFSVFIDTLIICTCTASIILLSGLSGTEISGVELTQNAMAVHVGEWGRVFVSLALMLFAFSSIMYNYYLGETSLNYFSESNRALFAGFRLLTVGLIFWGSLQDLATIFSFSDLTMGLLALVNLYALARLAKPGFRVLRDFERQLRSGVVEPVFDPGEFADLNIDRGAWQAEKTVANHSA